MNAAMPKADRILQWSKTQELTIHGDGNPWYLLWAKNNRAIYCMSNPIIHVEVYNSLPFIEN